MKFTTISLLLPSLLHSAAAWPHMSSDSTLSHIHHKHHHADFLSELSKRIASPEPQPQSGNDGDDSPGPLIGDLVNGATTPVGRSVTNILQGTESAESHEAGYRPAPFMSRACRKDTCCIWSHISRALTASFTGRGGRCNKWARAAIRLGFHDAGTWSKSLASRGQDFGGADGSIVLSGQEKGRPENKGLEEIIEMARRWQRIYGVGMGDLIQFAAIHAVVTCPLGPRIRFFAGRKDSSRPAPDGLLPGVFASADSLINLFEDKTISPHELAALLGAHSTSKQFFIDPRKSGAPQDSTPGVWDTLFYNQTTAGKTPSQVFKFQSDVVLAQDPRIKSEWESFAGQGGQEHWNEDYARAYTRLSLLGVNNINGLTECSKVLPAAKRGFRAGPMDLFDD